MRLFSIIAAAVVFMCALSFCEFGKINSIFGIDVRSAEVISDTDSHGWLGDGERFLVLKFSDGSVKDAVSKSSDWRPLPASDGITAVIWGVEYENEGGNYGVGPCTLADIPNVENGWYCFLDRSPGGHTLSGDPYTDGFSLPLNFTFAVYDSDEDILYYVESDS